MKIVGKVTLAQLAEVQRRGVGPEAAVDAFLAEAKRRQPGAAVIMQRSRAHSGFDIIAL